MVLKTVAGLVLYASALAAQDAEVRRILDASQTLKPPVSELGWYQLDWAPSLKEAKERAAREKRPICALICLNVYGNMFTGHC